MRAAPQLLERVPRPPRRWHPAPFEPTGGKHAESFSDFLQARLGEPVVGRHEGLWGCESCLLQKPRATVKPGADVVHVFRVELEWRMVTAVLHNVITGMTMQVADELWAVSDGHGRGGCVSRRPVARRNATTPGGQIAFQLSVGSSCVDAYVGD